MADIKIKENFKWFLLAIVVVVILIILISQKCNGDNTQKHGSDFVAMVPDSVKEVGDSSIKEVDLYVDFSGSMKGFVDMSGMPADAQSEFKNQITDALNNMSLKYKINPTCHYGNKNCNILEFQRELENASIFNKPTTLLHQFITNHCNHANDSSVTIIVSDLVLSYGKDKIANAKDTFYNQHHLKDLSGQIYSAMTVLKEKRLDVVILQYSSDFNGKYYYNCTENLKPFKLKDTLLHKRPFYVMLIGTKSHLKNILHNQCFKDFNNIYTSFSMEKKVQKIAVKRINSAAWSVGTASNSPGCIYTTEKPNKGEFTFSCTEQFYVPKYIEKNDTIFEFSDNIESVKMNNYNKDFTITIKKSDEISASDAWFAILYKPKKWIEESSIEDDVAVDNANDIEDKTWGFSTFMNAINKAYHNDTINYKNSDTIAKFSFQIINNN